MIIRLNGTEVNCFPRSFYHFFSNQRKLLVTAKSQTIQACTQ